MIAKENLVELTELMEILGYTDERSVKKWCERNEIPLFKAGSKKYTLSHYLTQYIDIQLVIFDRVNFSNPKEVFAVIKNNETTIEKKTNTPEGTLSVERKKSYKPNNEIISKYLNKYESNNKSKAA